MYIILTINFETFEFLYDFLNIEVYNNLFDMLIVIGKNKKLILEK